MLIVDSSSYVINDSGLDVSDDKLMDTSHVSVVRIDEEKVQVKDSTSYMCDNNLRSSMSDLSNTSSGKSASCKSEYGDEVRGTSIVLDAGHAHEAYKYKMNGQIVHSLR